ncbi:MAG: hypothetical protein ACLU3U_05770 [Gallintestinimicrobium sp.]
MGPLATKVVIEDEFNDQRFSAYLETNNEFTASVNGKVCSPCTAYPTPP